MAVSLDTCTALARFIGPGTTTNCIQVNGAFTGEQAVA